MSSLPPPTLPPVVHTGMKMTTPAAAEGSRKFPPSSSSYTVTNSVNDILQGKTFAQKIYTLLEVPKYSPIISWNEVGTVVTIQDVEAFKATILPVHFKQSKFGSFIRRMRRWGFSVIKQRSDSKASSGGGREESNVIEFSSPHFVRDQPNLCLLMRDERQLKKKFSFLDRTVKNKGSQEPFDGANNDDCLPSSKAESGALMSPSKSADDGMMPFIDIERPAPIHYPANNANDVPRPNVAINDGQLHNYSREYSMSSNQFSIQSTMPLMNNHMMMPTLQYPPPPPPHYPEGGFGSAIPAFHYPPYGYPQYVLQQQQFSMMHNQQQQELMQPNQFYPPPPTYTFHPTTEAVDTTTPTVNHLNLKTAVTNAALLSSSSEESTALDLLPGANIQPPNVLVHSPRDTE